jgi:hypothetical protein
MNDIEDNLRAALHRTEAPAEFVGKVMAEVRQSGKSPTRLWNSMLGFLRIPTMRVAAACVAICFLIIVVVVHYRQGESVRAKGELAKENAMLGGAKSEIVQKEIPIGPSRASSPKTVTFRFIRTADSTFNLDRLNGEKIVLERDGIEYVSTPIKTRGSEGVCTIAGVPPGECKLRLAFFRTTATVAIPAQPGNTVTLDFKISGQGIEIKPASEE